MQVVGRILPAMYYKSIKSQVGRMGTTLLLILVSLSRRDVEFPRRDVNFTCFCHVTTWTSHVATSIFTFSVTSRLGLSHHDVNLYKPLSRRDVVPHVATSFNYMLFHVATLNRTSRRWL